jgi:hypothetical protein
MVLDVQRHAPAALPPGKTRYALFSRLGGPQDRSGWVGKISPLTGFDPLTFQSVASRYADWATQALYYYYYYYYYYWLSPRSTDLRIYVWKKPCVYGIQWRSCSVVTVFQTQVLPFPIHSHISTFRSTCAGPNMAVVRAALISCFPAILLRLIIIIIIIIIII